MLIILRHVDKFWGEILFIKKVMQREAYWKGVFISQFSYPCLPYKMFNHNLKKNSTNET